MKVKKGFIIAAIVLAVLLVLFFVLKPGGKVQMTLETAPVTRSTITNSVTATGTVEPVTEVEVGTQVSGIINKLYVDYNDEVKAGQVIAEMDKVTLQAELESAQSNLASAKTEYDYRLKEYNRSKTLHEKELISEADYDLAVYNYQKALNSYKQSQASMVKVKRNLGYATITSPIDGVVISRAVEEGQTVVAGITVSAPAKKAAARSPFMPGPPGSGNKKVFQRSNFWSSGNKDSYFLRSASSAKPTTSRTS